MDDLENLEARKSALQRQIDDLEHRIEMAKQKAENERYARFSEFFRKMFSFIKVAESSFSDVSIGEIHTEGVNTVPPFSRRIDVEISGRHKGEWEGTDVCKVEELPHMPLDLNPTIALTFLIDFESVEDNPLFQEGLTLD